MSNIQVVKRTGLQEPFEPTKIQSVLLAAGLEPTKINQLLANITTWLVTQPNPISSLAIRDQVMVELDGLDPYIAGLFRWYQKSKDASIDV